MTEKRQADDVQPVVWPSGIEIKPVYEPADLAGFDAARDLGDPGAFPFTRGIHPLMYRKQPFTMRQYTGFATAAETNQRFRYLIAHGQNALNVAFDLPTQMGLDSDDPRAEGEVGRVGMAIDTLADVEEAFDGIPIDTISVSLTINAVASVMIAMYLVVAEKHGVPWDRVAGTAQNDILKEFIGRGAWIFPVQPSVRLIADTMEFCAQHAPRYNPVSVCGYHIRESGADAAQEMAYAFAIALCYLDQAVARGVPIDAVAPRMSFNFNIFGNLWEQVAKFRAGRRLWATLVEERYHPQNPRSLHLRMIAGGGGKGLTVQEPENNIIRGAYYALAGALGGCQTMALCCYDEAYTIPTPKAQLLSLRTMQILVEEMGLRDTVDPLAGSYFVEATTSAMEEKIREHLRRVEALGGILRAVEEGLIQQEVAHQAYREEQRVEAGDEIKVGVNKYRTEAPEAQQEVALHETTPAQEREQIARLQALRARRDAAATRRALDALATACATSENLMPRVLEAVRAYASVGEITEVFRKAFGTFHEPVRL